MEDQQTDGLSGVPEGYRSGFVAIVGRPNVGKSTLLNRIVGDKIAITTPKPQTTRERIRGIATFDDHQIIFVDTPGIHEADTRLNKYMVDQAVGTLGDVDLVYMLVDAPHAVAKREDVLAQTALVVEAVKKAGTPAFLVVNKVDKVKDKGELLPLIDELAGLHDFAEVVPVSALKGEGIELLLEVTRPRLPEGPPLFPEDQLTDRSLRFLVGEMVREQLFLRLKQEVPYQLAVSVDRWNEREDALVEIYATIHVAKDSHKAIVIGKGGRQIKDVGQRARGELERWLERRVYLDLRVRVEEGWYDRAAGLRKLGYED